MKKQMQNIASSAKIVELSEQYFINCCLKLFPHQNYKFELVEMPTNSIIPLCKYVYESRLAFAQKLIILYEMSSIRLFKPCIFIDSLGQKRIIAPPVIEQRDGINVLCDGTHRVYSTINNGKKHIKVLVAFNYELPLPGKLNRWGNVRLMPEQLPVESNFIDFNRNGLTGYSKFFNSEYYIDLQNMEKKYNEYL